MGSDFFSSWSLHTFTSFSYLAYPNYSGERYSSDDPLDFIQRIVIVDKMSEADGKQCEIHVIGLFQKKITFLVRKFQKFCVWLLTLYAFIICQVIIRTQYYINASLISAPVVILYQNV